VRVMVTGGTGMVGSHVVQALRADGHEVRLLVRDPARVSASLAPLGLSRSELDVRIGDVTDPAAVAASVAKCDAVIHAASVFSYQPADRAAMAATNVAGTRAVLAAAIAAGCDPVVHISSTTAVLPPHPATVDADSPVGEFDWPYHASKAASERVARELSVGGAPIVRVLPGAMLGPDDPYVGEAAGIVRDVVRGRLPVWPTHGIGAWVDVRDTAAVVVAALTPGLGPRGYVVPGWDLVGPALHRAAERVTGRRLRVLGVPSVLAGALATTVELAERVLPAAVTLPTPAEGTRVLLAGARYDASRTTTELGVTARPLDASLRDTIRWLVDIGELTAAQAGAALQR